MSPSLFQAPRDGECPVKLKMKYRSEDLVIPLPPAPPPALLQWGRVSSLFASKVQKTLDLPRDLVFGNLSASLRLWAAVNHLCNVSPVFKLTAQLDNFFLKGNRMYIKTYHVHINTRADMETKNIIKLSMFWNQNIIFLSQSVYRYTLLTLFIV